MSESVIAARGLGKRYRIGAKKRVRYATLRDQIVNLAKAPLRGMSRRPDSMAKSDGNDASHFWALKDVAFNIQDGEVIGIVGRNGAGKSTLLKILSRITEPTTGEVDIHGRVGSLLEVGTGFHPELTGRENVFLNGAILGMTHREINKKFDEIVAFSETERFLDTPVKHYSSGMQMRLAFSVAAHLEPEILLIDEVLAVGDASFQAKCLGKMESVAGRGRTVLFVSHNMGAIRKLCSRAIWIDEGKIRMDGAAADVVSEHLAGAMTKSANWTDSAQYDSKQEIQFTSARVLNNGADAAVVPYDSPFQVELSYRLNFPIRETQIAFYVEDLLSNLVFASAETDTVDFKGEIRSTGGYIATCDIPSHLLKPGRYSLSLAAYANRKETVHLKNVIAFEVSPVDCTMTSKRWGIIAPLLDWRVAEQMDNRPVDHADEVHQDDMLPRDELGVTK